MSPISRRQFSAAVAAGFASGGLVRTTRAQDAAAPEDVAKQYEQAVSRAVEYLRSKGQADDGSFSAQAGPAVTALAVAAVLRHGRSVDDPLIASGLKYVEGFVQPDGGVYREGSRHRNYETSVAIVCFAEANSDGRRYDELLTNADAFLKKLQWGPANGRDIDDVAYGGAGYGSHERPDLSNTSFLVDALRAAGNEPDDEAIQRALVFVSRCQNLESEYNTTKYAPLVDDGGFYYTIAAGGSSQAGETPDGGLRSYGSMTYAGLKSMIYAGVSQDDPRTKAAFDWIKQHYTLEDNPGMGDAGLFYYYHTFGKALDAMGVDTLTDANGQSHNWRAELIAELAGRQQADGSWVNANSRWLEGDPNLVTGYALLALSYCRPSSK